MSGFAPQGEGVQSGPYPGAQTPVVDGQPGVNTWHTPGTPGPDGCPIGGSKPSIDELNGIEQSLQCIMTNNGLDPLPTICAVDDPCALLNKLKELFLNCNVPIATQEQINALDPNTTYVVACQANGDQIRIPISDFGAGNSEPQECSDGFAIGTVFQFGTSGSANVWTQGQTYVGGTSQVTPAGSTGIWTAIDSGNNTGTEGDGPWPTVRKTSC